MLKLKIVCKDFAHFEQQKWKKMYSMHESSCKIYTVSVRFFYTAAQRISVTYRKS